MDLFAYLQLFHPVSEEDFQLLAGYLHSKKIKKGDYITTPGQIQRELFFVVNGVQMSYFETEEKLHVIAFTYSPGFCAIPESFFFQKPSQHFLKCLTDSEFECISFENLQKLFNQSQSIERLFRKMTETILAGMINRHVELHALSIEERYRAFFQRSPHLLQLVPHKYIASYLSINPTNFSKLFNTIRI